MSAPFDTQNRKTLAHTLCDKNHVVSQANTSSANHTPNASAWYTHDSVQRLQYYRLVLPDPLPGDIQLDELVRTYGADNEPLLREANTTVWHLATTGLHTATPGHGIIFLAPRVAVVIVAQ